MQKLDQQKKIGKIKSPNYTKRISGNALLIIITKKHVNKVKSAEIIKVSVPIIHEDLKAAEIVH
jgi:hypothetical protein